MPWCVLVACVLGACSALTRRDCAQLGFLVQEKAHFLFVEPDKDIGPAIRHLDAVREVRVVGVGVGVGVGVSMSVSNVGTIRE